MSKPARHGSQNRGSGPAALPKRALRRRFGHRRAMRGGIWIAPVRLLDVWLGADWLQFYLAKLDLLEIALLAGRQAGKLRPPVTQMQHFAHFVEKLGIRVVVPPAPGIAKFDDILSTRTSHLRAILSYGLSCRSDIREPRERAKKENQSAVKSARVDKKRARRFEQQKMNARAVLLFVDFLFVARREEIDSIVRLPR